MVIGNKTAQTNFYLKSSIKKNGQIIKTNFNSSICATTNTSHKNSFRKETFDENPQKFKNEKLEEKQCLSHLLPFRESLCHHLCRVQGSSMQVTLKRAQAHTVPLVGEYTMPCQGSFKTSEFTYV